LRQAAEKSEFRHALTERRQSREEEESGGWGVGVNKVGQFGDKATEKEAAEP